MTDLSLWEGDGLPEYQEWWDLVMELDMTEPEIRGWIEATKREAWIKEHSAKYQDDGGRTLAIAQYFWRRHEKLREYFKRFNEQLDKEVKNAC